MYVITNQSIIDYLLGKLSEKEELKFIEQVFDRDENSEKYEIVREDLIEDYLKGKLSADEKLRFETHFLANPFHQKLFNFSKTLRGHLEETFLEKIIATATVQNAEQEKKLWFGLDNWLVPISALGTLLVVGGIICFAVFNYKNQIAVVKPPNSASELTVAATQPLENSKIENSSQDKPSIIDDSKSNNLQNKSVERTPQENLKPTPAKQLSRVVSYTLAFALKGGDGDELKISKETETINFRTFHPLAGFQSYVARIKSKDGNQIWEKEFTIFQKTGKVNQILFSVPANLFQSGEYTFRFEGKSVDGTAKQLPELKFVVKREK